MGIIRVGVGYEFEPVVIRLPNGKFAAYVKPLIKEDPAPGAPDGQRHFDTQTEALQAATKLASRLLVATPQSGLDRA